ncbi:hypothetical protein O6H91_12G063100 [Diphasiastrum complanatum]|uniref:Uncharacterized protein n=1 Tax=Diphasiastrum complanatum TaxID=34168 RepID=A0ACC2C2Q1_DIPCM|nr:hypothetical protein O6H91_12G063100 [Diphasiastrum complanatum]
MEGVFGEDGAGKEDGVFSRWRAKLSQIVQHNLDKTVPHPLARWLGTLAAAAIYWLRVYYLQGFYIITYGLGIYILNLLIGFLSPQVDPESEGPTLPTSGTDEFKPFIRRLPEFKFWYALTKAVCIAFILTFFSMFDVPVFWPILLMYWIVLFFLTMKRQVMHMLKYRYIPFSFGKQRYSGKRPTSPDKAPMEFVEEKAEPSQFDSEAAIEVELT